MFLYIKIHPSFLALQTSNLNKAKSILKMCLNASSNIWRLIAHVCCVYCTVMFRVILCGVCMCPDRQCPWLLRQVEIDTHFLRRLNVLDYSLLLAHQPLHHDERHQSLSFATLIMRTKKSVYFSCFSCILWLEVSIFRGL